MPDPTKNLAYYDGLPYTCELVESDGSFVAHHPDLPGCATSGEDIHDALENLAAARRLWLQARLQDGQPVPEPSRKEPSGRLILRVPIRLHDKAESIAAARKKSLNGLLNEVFFNYLHSLPADTGLEVPTEDNALPATTPEGRPLAIRLTPEDDGTLLAEYPDFPGCLAAGDDVHEALANLAEARELWESGRGEAGLPAPEPLSATHSGRINLRLSRELHGALKRDAQRNGATLNQLLCVILSEAVGRLAEARLGLVETPSPYDLTIASVVQYLRRNPHRDDLESTWIDLPESHRTFLRALVCLEKHDPSAFDYIAEAYIQGLDFSTAAVRVFHSMHSPPDTGRRSLVILTPRSTPDAQNLQGQIMAMFHGIPEDRPGRDAMNNLMKIFLDGVKGRRQGQEHWRAQLRKYALQGIINVTKNVPRGPRDTMPH